MRHFMCLTCAPAALPYGMPAGATTTQLIAAARAQHGFTPANRSARARTVDIATITVPADAHLLAATHTVVQPVRCFPARRHAHSTKDWTTPCIAGIKAIRTCLKPRVRRKARGSGQELARAFALSAAEIRIARIQALPKARLRSPSAEHLALILYVTARH